MTAISRRDLLKAAAAAGAFAAARPLGASAASLATSARSSTLGSPANCPVDTVVVVMMENRSFDHMLGWVPGADGVQAGLSFLDDEGVSHSTELWGRGGRNDFAGHDYTDPDHSWNGGRVQLGGEARDCSGFMKGRNDEFALSFYAEEDLPTWAAFARQGVILDRYFTAVLSSTYPNRYYMHAADSGGRKDNTLPGIEGYPETTIWDRLSAAGVSWKYYFSNIPVVALYGRRFAEQHGANVQHISNFYADCQAGTLPHVAFVDPFFLGDDQGVGNDDHPAADIRLGQQFLAGVSRAFSSGPQWRSGALFVNYDEWGGFFDHVAPPSVADARQSTALAEDFGQLGFRCPAVALSPYAARGTVNSSILEHTSILRFVEWRFALDPLTVRDANAPSIAAVLDFDSPPNTDELEIPLYLAPPEAHKGDLGESPTEWMPGQAEDRFEDETGVPWPVPDAPWPVDRDPRLPDHPWPFPADGVQHPPGPTAAPRPRPPVAAAPSDLWIDLVATGRAEALGYRVDWLFADSFFER